ncbi:MAG TPA: PepSY-associated TM helix domain-containing protein [Pyrinomonadaceae bacterium]|nr:PepSY-associated TM helix domain-containing protein [Pyrinomonadaceae bacterium]
MNPAERKRRAAVLRISRKIHRTTGALLFAFFFLTAVTGLLLGWKKHSGGYILADTAKGKSSDQNDWLSISVLTERADQIARERIDPNISTELDRIDIRPDKGIVKFVYLNNYWGVQLDMTTGELLQIERRRSDFIERVHDGTVLDLWFGVDGGYLKLAYTSVLGTALLIFTITGFWLWLGPIEFRRHSRRTIGLKN